MVEHLVGGADALVVPVLEVELAEGSHLRLVTCQRLDPTAWHVGRSSARLGKGASLRQAVVGVGARYDRSRNDAVLLGAESHNELRTTFLGSGDQVHDFRTHQLHLGARSRSTLLSKGAAGDVSRSIYTGLIEIEKGAQSHRRAPDQPQPAAVAATPTPTRSPTSTSARTTSCAPTRRRVGPLDALQLWYLESRGVEPARARELILLGFFLEMLDDMPPAVARLVEADVSATLAKVGGSCVSEVDVGALSDFADGAARPGARRRPRPARWCACGDDVYVLDDRCSHEEFWLSEGEVDAESREIECARHGAMFRLVDGAPTSLPATRPVARYDARVVDGRVDGGGRRDRELAHRGAVRRGRRAARSCRASTSSWRSGEVHVDDGPERLGQVDAGPRPGRAPRLPGRPRGP